MPKNITQKSVKELFDYNPDTGALSYKERFLSRGRPSRKNGTKAGGISKNGYLTVSINYKRYYCHRIIWLWFYGYLPESEIDHINRNRADNKIENLREASRSCNIRNSCLRSDNRSRVAGVFWDSQNNNWRATIIVNKKSHNLGSSKDFNEVVLARLAGEEYFGWCECNHSSSAHKYALENKLIRSQ